MFLLNVVQLCAYVQNVALINKSKDCDSESPAPRQVPLSATVGLPQRQSEAWGQMSAPADVHQYLAANIPDRQQLRAGAGVRPAFKPDGLKRSLSEANSHSAEMFSAVPSNACLVRDGKALESVPSVTRWSRDDNLVYNREKPGVFSHSQQKPPNILKTNLFLFFFAKCHWFNL